MRTASKKLNSPGSLGHLQTREVGQVLQRVVQRIDKHLRRHGLFHSADQDAEQPDAELFVGVLPASGMIFAKATRTQQLADWVNVHADAFEFFGGTTRAFVPDQLRSAVSAPDAYEPTINRTYSELARHYGTAIVPARPSKPQDKGAVGRAVLTAQRWILACLRHETFFSLATLNERIAQLLDDVNCRPQRQLGGVSRRELFERIERGCSSHCPLVVAMRPFGIDQ